MDKKLRKLLEKFKRLKLPDKKYAICGSVVLGLRGIRKPKDLDIVVTKDLYKRLKKRFPENPRRKGLIRIGEIEICASWSWEPKIKRLKIEKMIKRAELIRGLRFFKLEDLIEWKKKLGRKKDFKDINLIKKYLKIKN